MCILLHIPPFKAEAPTTTGSRRTPVLPAGSDTSDRDRTSSGEASSPSRGLMRVGSSPRRCHTYGSEMNSEFSSGIMERVSLKVGRNAISDSMHV